MVGFRFVMRFKWPFKVAIVACYSQTIRSSSVYNSNAIRHSQNQKPRSHKHTHSWHKLCIKLQEHWNIFKLISNIAIRYLIQTLFFTFQRPISANAFYAFNHLENYVQISLYSPLTDIIPSSSWNNWIINMMSNYLIKFTRFYVKCMKHA